MKRRSFFGALTAGISSLLLNPVVSLAKSKTKVEPFWDWQCRIKQDNGKIVKKTLHLGLRSTPPIELTRDGKNFVVVSSDFKKRTVLYRHSSSLDERVARYMAANPSMASAHSFSDSIPVSTRGGFADIVGY